MSFDAKVLRAMVQLAGAGSAPEDDDVAAIVLASAGAVRASLRRMRAAGLVEDRNGTRLTMSGLAVAVALLPASAPRRKGNPVLASRAA